MRVFAGERSGFAWQFDFSLYIAPASSERLVVPFHRCQMFFEVPGWIPRTEGRLVTIGPPDAGPFGDDMYKLVLGERELPPHSLTVRETRYEVILDGPGQVLATATAGSELRDGISENDLRITLQFRPVGTELPTAVDAVLRRRSARGADAYEWSFGR